MNTISPIPQISKEEKIQAKVITEIKSTAQSTIEFLDTAIGRDKVKLYNY